MVMTYPREEVQGQRSVGSEDKSDKNSSGDEIANVNFYAVRPWATRIRWNNAK